MAIFSKESLEVLRQRIDLVDVLSSHMDLKKSGAAYKGLCPFHDEKTPSFVLQKGDSHYHCFGCGAHGDAIQFLMTHVKLSFSDSVESLAQRYQVPLERVNSSNENSGPSKGALKEALEHACHFFHFNLLHTEDGHAVLNYLYNRGMSLDFIRQFQIGLAPKAHGMFRKVMHAKFIKDEIMVDAGLISPSQNGGYRDFFYERITFPIRDLQGGVIGFSARKYREETFGGKYINTSETPLFKKSKVLFGLNYCRKRIAKERMALIVEGQIDALRLIHLGFDIAVASQGTAFGESHAKELINLGVNKIFIATDGDNAGYEAACKIGNFFQKEGIEVYVLNIPSKRDPDSFLCEYGPEAFASLMDSSPSYLEFLVSHRAKFLNMDSPAGKNELVQMIAKQIQEWTSPLMVHESLRKLAQLAQVPESTIGIGEPQQPNIFIKSTSKLGAYQIDPDRILEFDCLRWLLLMGEAKPELVSIARLNLVPENLKIPEAQSIYNQYLKNHATGKACDLLSLAAELDDDETQKVLSEILERKINREKAMQQFPETIQRILERNWMGIREDIRQKIQSGACSDEEAMDLAKVFDDLKKNPPKVQL